MLVNCVTMADETKSAEHALKNHFEQSRASTKIVDE